MTKNIDMLRARIAVLKGKAKALQTAPQSHAEQRAALLAHLRAQADEVDRRTAARLAQGDLAALLSVRTDPSGLVTLTPLLSSVLGAEALAAMLDKHIMSAPDGPPALERAARLAEIDAELLAAESTEERLIEASEQTTTPIARRADADPRAVLGEHEA